MARSVAARVRGLCSSAPDQPSIARGFSLYGPRLQPVAPSLTQVLLCAAPYSPFSQPRNLIGGHIIATVIGISCQKLIVLPEFAMPASVAFCIMAQMATDTIHPPGGGIALIAGTNKPSCPLCIAPHANEGHMPPKALPAETAPPEEGHPVELPITYEQQLTSSGRWVGVHAVLQSERILRLGWRLFYPVFLSVFLMLAVALLNNVFRCFSAKRKYPSGGLRKLYQW